MIASEDKLSFCVHVIFFLPLNNVYAVSLLKNLGISSCGFSYHFVNALNLGDGKAFVKYGYKQLDALYVLALGIAEINRRKI